MNTKMDYRKAILVSLPFFAITIFWQAYDTIMPQILVYHFGMNSTTLGMIMGIDNLVALIFLPLFGALSDKVNSRLGRRTPFILWGTIGGAISFVLMGLADNMQLARLTAAGIPAKFAAATTGAAKAALIGEIGALQRGNVGIFVLMMGALLLGVFLMSIFRSPAAALAADVFIRPQRSKGNAVLNILGGLAGVVFLLLNKRLASLYGGYFNLMMLSAIVMLFALAVYMIFVRERKLLRQVEEDNVRLGLVEEIDTHKTGKKIPPEVLKSMIFILAVVVFVYMGYNAFSTHFAIYAIKQLGMTPASISGPLLVRVFSVLIFCIPSAMLSTKIGRKMTARIGLVILAVSVSFVYFLTPETARLLTPIFAVYGLGFAMVSVHLGPMVVELCSSADVGRYMGYYYLATTVAQIITPALAGVFLDRLGQRTIALYSAVFMVLGFLATLFIRHGDAKPISVNAADVLGSSD
ncbi:MAG: MFS transporter [Spirochaetia bacterium]|jgi:Na+/melibiose symporter-like transporter|nr:MFS transporter [Spirochaetia bacterium]